MHGVGCDTGMPRSEMRTLAQIARAWSCRATSIRCCSWRAEQALERQVVGIPDGASAACRIIFNLGHGIVPETPPENVARLVDWFVPDEDSATCHPGASHRDPRPLSLDPR